ncbi:protein of unknown function [Candidatus Methylocalor cossyra]|uniref:Secreted protein n=1 Tax=Candidatus Methylocalor cossyra TaxID=3108543 RepID=A0ABP1C527_9GAMM
MGRFAGHLQRLIQVAVILLDVAGADAFRHHPILAIAQFAAEDDGAQVLAVQSRLLIGGQVGIVHRDAQHAADFFCTRLEQAGFGPMTGGGALGGRAALGEGAAFAAHHMNTAIVGSLHQGLADPAQDRRAVLPAPGETGLEHIVGQVQGRGAGEGGRDIPRRRLTLSLGGHPRPVRSGLDRRRRLTPGAGKELAFIHLSHAVTSRVSVGFARFDPTAAHFPVRKRPLRPQRARPRKTVTEMIESAAKAKRPVTNEG